MENFNEKIEELNNTKDTTGEYDKQDIENNKVMMYGVSPPGTKAFVDYTGGKDGCALPRCTASCAVP